MMSTKHQWSEKHYPEEGYYYKKVMAAIRNNYWQFRNKHGRDFIIHNWCFWLATYYFEFMLGINLE
jgi:hypothetical protein